MNPARPSSGRPELPSSQLSTSEYLVLVALLAAGIVTCALLVNYALTQRGMLAPSSRPTGSRPGQPPSFNPDYQAPSGTDPAPA